ncbi:hypothetical protein ABEB36_015320 [Hypothenemus hampei]|uniref:MADF domain-containing protein n=1 Tax=Hypothenemus hampei TaxID=57062 RepID=A0ABD1E1V7_HYPHA
MTERRVNWYSEDDEILIDFIKNHEGLYNVKSAKYRKIIFFSAISGTDCSKRWAYIRDYYVRKRGKPSTGSSGEATKKRSDLLSFLYSCPSAKRRQMMLMMMLPQKGTHQTTLLYVTIASCLYECQKNEKKSTSEARLQLLQEIAHKPRHMQESQDDTDLYFASMAKIVKRLP